MKKVGSEYWIWLQSALGPGANTAAILGFYKEPESVYNALCSRELDMLIPAAVKKRMTQVSPSQSYPVQKRCSDNGWHIITPDCEAYPDSFRILDSMPLVLYVNGDPSLIGKSLAIGFVGTRNASAYGKEVARRLAYAVAAAGMTVVSGCAIGIDSNSHYGALCAKGKTVAYLGTGLDADYPKSNRSLRRAIALHGALVSEYPPGYAVTKANFPIRNRLIAASTLGVVVVEANQKSGALITARYASQYGKDVFAVPGNITNSAFTGGNHLIHDGAKPVFDAMDILEEYAYMYGGALDLKKAQKVPQSLSLHREEATAPPKEQPVPAENPGGAPEEKPKKIPPAHLSVNEKKIWELLQTEGSSDTDYLAAKTGMDIPSLLSALLSMELQGVICKDENNRYRI